MGSTQKQKNRKAKPTAAVLLWGLDRGTPKGDAVRAILKELGVVAKTVLPERLGDSAGAALGLVGMRPALMPYAGPVPECEFMLLANFSEPLLRDNLFPPMVGHMTKIGEETGQIEDMLNRLADYYDEEVEMTTQTVMAVLEPMIILVLAAIVCVLIAAVMAPMLSMYQNLDNI